MALVEGVGFIIYEKGKILVEKRKLSKKIDPGKIIIPGGHIEQGETPQEACIREIKEELGIECKKIEYVTRLPYLHPIEPQMINYFLCRELKGKPIAKEAEKIFWIDPIKEITQLDFEIDKKAVKKMLKLLQQQKNTK